MNKYFQAFKAEITWFNYKNEPIDIFEIENFFLTKKFETIFPVTSELINKSVKTGVEYKGKSLILFTWKLRNEICGWMCQFDKSRINLSKIFNLSFWLCIKSASMIIEFQQKIKPTPTLQTAPSKPPSNLLVTNYPKR